MTFGKSGFTLLEMSIVLLIIGFLAGVSVVGKELIDNANKQQFLQDYQKIDSSVVAFKEKYQYYPGDFSAANASDFFPNCASTGGNQDGLIFRNNAVPFDGLVSSGGGELDDFFTHLACSNLGPLEFGMGTPFSRYTDSTKTTTEEGIFSYTGPDYNRYTAIVYLVGGLPQNAIAPDYAFYLDRKVDDGLPNNGGVIVRSSNGVNNFDTNSYIDPDCGNALANTYNLTVRSEKCYLRILNP